MLASLTLSCQKTNMYIIIRADDFHETYTFESLIHIAQAQYWQVNQFPRPAEIGEHDFGDVIDLSCQHNIKLDTTLYLRSISTFQATIDQTSLHPSRETNHKS